VTATLLGTVDLRGTALCPAEVTVDMGPPADHQVTVDVPVLAAEVSVELCPPEA
jgi:hypothetical protein